MTGHRFNPEKAEKLLDPKRKELVSPEQVLSLLEIQEGEMVADLGAGNGYFTVPIAKITKETVYAVDVQPQMLDFLKEHAQKEGVTNIECITSNINDVPLNSDSVDKVLIAFVIHEIPNLDDVLNEVKRILKPNGKFLILEWEAVESEMGPPLHERIPSKNLEEYFKKREIHTELFHLNKIIYGILITL